MSQLNLLNSQTTGGYSKQYKKFVSRGNLNYMYQRMDIGLLEATREYPDRLYLKIGKIKTPDAEFRCDREQAQGYYETSPDKIKELRETLLRFEIMLRKRSGNYDYEYQNYEDVKAIVSIHKEEARA